MQVSLPKEARTCQNFVGGQWDGEPSRSVEVTSPYNGATIGQVVCSQSADVDRAVAAAVAASQAWRATPLKERTQLLLAFRQQLIDKMDELAHVIASESGKTLGEARAGLAKGIEVAEFAASLQNLDIGGAMDVSRGVSCEYRREPLGVVAGIVPFNFPAMVPMWMFPIAVTLGNCFIMKPSEKVPLTLSYMAELMTAAGYPAGVFSLVNGAREASEALIDHPDVHAVAFVGSTAIAKQVYTRTTAMGKRCLALGGAKNLLFVTPDAEESMTVDGVTSSFMGCAGQRCMAASLMVGIGAVDAIVDGVVARARRCQLGEDMGALIDAAARDRLHAAIDQAEKDGAKILLDGRTFRPPAGCEQGYWLGPTIIDGVEPDMDCAQTELFGPVLSIVRRPTIADALALEHASPYGNATSIFTTSGAAARYVASQATNGMVGVNIGVPVPREPFSFGGTKASKFGHGDITGESSLDFWSDRKKITMKWSVQTDTNWMA